MANRFFVGFFRTDIIVETLETIEIEKKMSNLNLWLSKWNVQ